MDTVKERPSWLGHRSSGTEEGVEEEPVQGGGESSRSRPSGKVGILGLEHSPLV